MKTADLRCNIVYVVIRRWFFFYMFGHLRDFVHRRLEKTKKVRPGNLTIRHAQCRASPRHFVASHHACFALIAGEGVCSHQAGLRGLLHPPYVLPNSCALRLRRVPSYSCTLQALAQYLALTAICRCLGINMPPADACCAPQDCFNRPIASAPDRVIDVLVRTPVSGQKCV